MPVEVIAPTPKELSVPTLVKDEPTTAEPRVVAFKTLAPPMLTAPPTARVALVPDKIPVDVTLPTFKELKVPTLVKDEARTLEPRVVRLRTVLPAISTPPPTPRVSSPELERFPVNVPVPPAKLRLVSIALDPEI
jgi:hypothetical protein